LLGLFDGK
jgi:hypothetical protein